MNKKNLTPFVIVIIFVSISYIFLKPGNLGDIKYVKLAGQDIRVELAVTQAEQEQGLSGRQNLNENEGMLFVFNPPAKYSFWMKDMNFPIDMIWINADMKVIYIQKNASPESYPTAYGPDAHAKYVLEVVSGFSDKNNLQIGDTAELTF